MVLLQGGGLVCILGFFAVYVEVLISQPPVVSPLEHVVGPLWAAASLPVDKAASAGWEGTATPPAVVYPGFLPVAIIVLEESPQMLNDQSGITFHDIHGSHWGN